MEVGGDRILGKINFQFSQVKCSSYYFSKAIQGRIYQNDLI